MILLLNEEKLKNMNENDQLKDIIEIPEIDHLIKTSELFFNKLKLPIRNYLFVL